MKRNTIKWRIYKYNLVVIIMLITLVTIIFNLTVPLYIEKDILGQMRKIASRTEDTALRHGPGFFSEPRRTPPPPPPYLPNNNDLLRYYIMLERSLREPLTVLNADYILLDRDKKRITPFPEEFLSSPAELLDQITDEIRKSKHFSDEAYLNFNLSGTEYIAIVKPVFQKNSFGLGWIIIFSSIQKVKQLQFGINVILFTILIISALIMMAFSSHVSKKISAPFSSLNQHIKSIAERNFGSKIQMPVDDELRDFVNNINVMSEKLQKYDQAQKTFLQNASHEFRTPLMSIQSYAEGMKYNVVDNNTAIDIIISESRRMAQLVENLLYLSRLDALEENYHFSRLDFNELINSCIERVNGIAIKSGIKIVTDNLDRVEIYADEEKLSRAIANVISNCIRYAGSSVVIASEIKDNKIVLNISDDGPGFETNELPNIFERFYKGKKGNIGLGLAISKNIIEKHNGRITAENSQSGALFLIELESGKGPTSA